MSVLAASLPANPSQAGQTSSPSAPNHTSQPRPTQSHRRGPLKLAGPDKSTYFLLLF